MLDLDGLDVRAVSVGGFETCIELPRYKVAFDIGRCPPTAVGMHTLLLTHGHVDHMGGLVHHCAQRDLLGRAPPLYVVPVEIEEPLQDMLAAWRRLARSALPCTVRGVSPGDVVDLGKGRRAHVFRAVHRVPTVGYAIETARHRLKAAYQGRPGHELGRLRAEGVEITEPDPRVEVAFCGDTTVDVLREPVVRKARRLILEVTFLDDRVSVAHARKGGHVHLHELVPHLDGLEASTILCTHASRRYHGQIDRLLREGVPEAHRDRLVPLLPAAPWA